MCYVICRNQGYSEVDNENRDDWYDPIQCDSAIRVTKSISFVYAGDYE